MSSFSICVVEYDTAAGWDFAYSGPLVGKFPLSSEKVPDGLHPRYPTAHNPAEATPSRFLLTR